MFFQYFCLYYFDNVFAVYDLRKFFKTIAYTCILFIINYNLFKNRKILIYFDKIIVNKIKQIKNNNLILKFKIMYLKCINHNF